MDADRFDTLTRSLTAAGSRRRALAAVLAGSLGVLGSTASAKKKKKKKGKNKDRNTDCPQSKPNRCGDKCCKPSEACIKGKCVNHCNDGKKNFGETGVDCGGTCIDPPGSGFGTCVIGQGCDDDGDCFSAVCEVTASGQKQCVFCRASRDCSLIAPDRPACINFECFQCSRDADCPRPGQPPERDKCVEPVSAECPAGHPCACRQCRNSVDCAQGQTCDENGACIECISNADCPRSNQPEEQRVCVNGVCRECAQTADCVTAGDVCVQNTCVTPAVCPAGRDLCSQGFVTETVCGGNCRCYTTTDNETRCLAPFTGRCDDPAQPPCTSRAECEARHGPGAFCTRDTGNFCGCAGCALQCGT